MRFSRSPGAYPRGRGGTLTRDPTTGEVEGLSPRTRGNHHDTGETTARHGPIPADAGEPSDQPPRQQLDRAYPRGRGGTLAADARQIAGTGLSPRTRGNLI